MFVLHVALGFLHFVLAGFDHGAAVGPCVVDAKNHYIKCSNSKQVGFEKLIICTGSEPNHLARLPGDDLTNIFYLRREHEFSYLIEHLLQFKQRRAAAILGGGYLGLEVATSLCGWGFNEVHLIFPGDYLFQKHHGWTKAFRERIEEEIKKRSGGRLKLYPQQTIQMMVPNYKDDGGEQNIGGVVLEDGTVLDAQLLICCVGAKPTGRELFGSLNFDVKTLKCESDVFACGEVAIPECGVEAARAMGRFVAQQAFNEVNHKEEKENEENHQNVFSITPFHYSRLFEFSDKPLIWYEIGIIDEKKKKLVSFIDSSHSLFGIFYYTNEDCIQAAVVSGSSQDVDFMNSLKNLILNGKCDLKHLKESFSAKGITSST